MPGDDDGYVPTAAEMQIMTLAMTTLGYIDWLDHHPTFWHPHDGLDLHDEDARRILDIRCLGNAGLRGELHGLRWALAVLLGWPQFASDHEEAVVIFLDEVRYRLKGGRPVPVWEIRDEVESERWWA